MICSELNCDLFQTEKFDFGKVMCSWFGVAMTTTSDDVYGVWAGLSLVTSAPGSLVPELVLHA